MSEECKHLNARAARSGSLDWLRAAIDVEWSDRPIELPEEGE